MVVHKLLGFYLCPIRCHMTWQQRTVYFLQSLQEFSPVLLLTAMLQLPGAMLYQQFHPGHIRQNYESPSLKALFMLTYLMAKINHHVLHGRIGLARVSKLQAHDVWTAPCKFSHSHLITVTDVLTNFTRFCGALSEGASTKRFSHFHAKRIHHFNSK